MIADELEDDEVSAKCADSKDDSISRTNAAGPSVRTLCPAPPRRRCVFSAPRCPSTGPRKNACTAAPHKIRFKVERTSTACVITCSRESQHEKSLRSLRRPLRWPFDDSGVCPWRRNGLASFLRRRWHSRHWWRLRHEPRRPWDQLVGYRAFVKRRGQRPPEGTTARHQSRHRP